MNVANNNNMVKQVSNAESDLCLPELNFYNHSTSFNKVPSTDPLMNKYISRDDNEWNLESQKQTCEIDLMNFHSAVHESTQDYVKREEDYFSTDDDEYLPSTATNMSPTSNPPSNRQKMNDYLIGALEPTDFMFDPLSLTESPEDFWKNRGSSMLGASH